MRKAPRLRRMRPVIALFILVVVTLGFAFWQLHHSAPSSPISTIGWKEFSDSTTNIKFMYPQNTKPFSDPSDPSGILSNNYVRYILNSPDYSLDQSYKNAEAQVSGKTLLLDIFASTTKPADYTTTNGDFVTLGSADKTINLWKSSTYSYVLLTHGDRWGNRMYVLQCSADRKCRSTIDRDGQRFKYLQIAVYADENWRHGGSQIDSSSSDYQIFKEVMKTIRF